MAAAEARLSKLSTGLRGSNTDLKGLQTAPPPESWDDFDEDQSPVEAPGPTLRQITSNDNPTPPPPTPISPTTASAARNWESNALSPPDSRAPTARREDKRPEKTTASANRMIAGALGLKAPKKTEEQKQYDRAVKEAEIKRRNKEKEAIERQRVDDEQAKVAVWDS